MRKLPDVLSIARQLLIASVLVVPPLSVVAEEKPDDQAVARSTVRKIPSDYPSLIKALDHDNFYVREWGHQVILREACDFVRREKKLFPRKDQLCPSLKGHSAEQRRHLEEILARIGDAESSMLLTTPSVFHAPAGWGRKGHTETLSAILRTLAADTGQPLALHGTPSGFLDSKASTQGLDGKTFWEILHGLRTGDGETLSVTSDSNGSIYVQPLSYSHPPGAVATSGPTCLCVYLTGAGDCNILLMLEPKLRRMSWEVRSAEATLADGTTVSLIPVTEGRQTYNSFRLKIPPDLRGKMSVRLTLRVTARVIDTVAVKDVSLPQEFAQEGYSVAFRGIRAESKDSFAVASDLLPGVVGLPEGTVENLGCTAIGADGLPVIPRSVAWPHCLTGGPWALQTAEKPSGVLYHLPTQKQATEEQVFQFKLDAN